MDTVPRPPGLNASVSERRERPGFTPGRDAHAPSLDEGREAQPSGGEINLTPRAPDDYSGGAVLEFAHAATFTL